jgi:hypothetical protein
MYIPLIVLVIIIVLSLVSYNREDFRRHGGSPRPRSPNRRGRPRSPNRRGRPRSHNRRGRPRSPNRYVNRRWRRNRGWGWNVWQYLYPNYYYPYYTIPENPGCDGKACGGYCNPYNSRCCGGTSPSTCGLGYCSNNSLCN